jgi:hypothetical protein
MQSYALFAEEQPLKHFFLIVRLKVYCSHHSHRFLTLSVNHPLFVGQRYFGFFSGRSRSSLTGFGKNLPLSLRASVFFPKTLTALNPPP